jgi:hypothetical protein
MRTGSLGEEHDLNASLSFVDTRQVANDYTIRFDRKNYQIAHDQRAGLRGADVRVEFQRADEQALASGHHELSELHSTGFWQATAMPRPATITRPRNQPRRVQAVNRDGWDGILILPNFLEPDNMDKYAATSAA